MLGYLTVIFCCQLIGELAVTGLALPVPGPVVGMVILFLGLLAKGAVPENLGKTADGLLTNLSLCFVPAGVGVILHVKLIGEDWLPISVGLLASTLLAIAVSALLMQWLSPRQTDDGDA